jgi:hypothetical protein
MSIEAATPFARHVAKNEIDSIVLGNHQIAIVSTDESYGLIVIRSLPGARSEISGWEQSLLDLAG